MSLITYPYEYRCSCVREDFYSSSSWILCLEEVASLMFGCFSLYVSLHMWFVLCSWSCCWKLFGKISFDEDVVYVVWKMSTSKKIVRFDVDFFVFENVYGNIWPFSLFFFQFFGFEILAFFPTTFCTHSVKEITASGLVFIFPIMLFNCLSSNALS